MVETENNKIFVPNKTMFDLPEFTSGGRNTEDNVKITYRLTEDKIERCFHKDGFLQNLTTVVEITMAEKN